jgi:hypothetical protein
MGMFKLWLLIAVFFVGAVTGVLGWVSAFEHHREFAARGESAMAQPVGKTQKPGRALTILDEARYEFPLRFKTSAGDEVTTMAFVPQRALDAIAKDGAAPVIYSRDDPKRVVFAGDLERMPKNYGWLLFGIVSGLVGVALIRVRHRFTGRLPVSGYTGDAEAGSE